MCKFPRPHCTRKTNSPINVTKTFVFIKPIKLTFNFQISDFMPKFSHLPQLKKIRNKSMLQQLHTLRICKHYGAYLNMSHVMSRNPTSCICETKGVVTVKLISAFVFATWISVGPVQKPHCWFSHEAAHMLFTFHHSIQLIY